MIDATSVSIRFSKTEDRLFLDATGLHATQKLVLTRRITQHLISAFATLLEKSSVARSRAPWDMRTEVITIEHMTAIHRAGNEKSNIGSSKELPREDNCSLLLVSQVDVKIIRNCFQIIFHSQNTPVVRVICHREKFHQLLAALDGFSRQAQWNIQGNVEWLGVDRTAANHGSAKAS